MRPWVLVMLQGCITLSGLYLPHPRSQGVLLSLIRTFGEKTSTFTFKEAFKNSSHSCCFIPEHFALDALSGLGLL